MLDKNKWVWYNIITSNGVYFFVRVFKAEKMTTLNRNSALREAIMPAKGEKIGGAESESKNYVGVYRV